MMRRNFIGEKEERLKLLTKYDVRYLYISMHILIAILKLVSIIFKERKKCMTNCNRMTNCD